MGKSANRYRTVRRIERAFDVVEVWHQEKYRKDRNKIESDWNEGRIDEAKYYRNRQLLDHDFDCKMAVHDETVIR